MAKKNPEGKVVVSARLNLTDLANYLHALHQDKEVEPYPIAISSLIELALMDALITRNKGAIFPDNATALEYLKKHLKSITYREGA